MAVGAYTKKTWANRPATTTPLSAANLQIIDDQIQNITDAIVAGGANPTKVWTSTNDGNAGQPPAPKPGAATDSDIKQFRLYSSGAGNAAILPAGGTWAYSLTQYSSSLVYNDATGGVTAGGSTVGSASVGAFWVGSIWRIA